MCIKSIRWVSKQHEKKNFVNHEIPCFSTKEREIKNSSYKTHHFIFPHQTHFILHIHVYSLGLRHYWDQRRDEEGIFFEYHLISGYPFGCQLFPDFHYPEKLQFSIFHHILSFSCNSVNWIEKKKKIDVLKAER